MVPDPEHLPQPRRLHRRIFGAGLLFEADNTPTLVDELRKEFCGKGQVTAHTVRTFVENKTAYLKKHMTAALKQEEDASKVRVEPLKMDGKKRRANTYPDAAKLAWV